MSLKFKAHHIRGLEFIRKPITVQNFNWQRAGLISYPIKYDMALYKLAITIRLFLTKRDKIPQQILQGFPQQNENKNRI